MLTLITGAKIKNTDKGSIRFQYSIDSEYSDVIVQETISYKEICGVLTPFNKKVDFLLSLKNNWLKENIDDNVKMYTHSKSKYAERVITLVFPFGIRTKLNVQVQCHLKRETHNTVATITDKMNIEIPKDTLSKVKSFFLCNAFSQGNKTSKDVWECADASVTFT